MKKETRTVVYDDALRIEAYRFEGPGDNHACVQADGGTLDYRGFKYHKGNHGGFGRRWCNHIR